MHDGSDSDTPLGHLDREFADRLDLWGAYFRIMLVAPGLALALFVLSARLWVAGVLASYLCVALFVPFLLRSRRVRPHMARVRPWLVLIDVLVVSLMTYGWGTEVAPASLLYAAVVVGWTLVPQHGMGLLSLLAVLVSVLALLVCESLGVLPVAPFPLTHDAARGAPGGAVLMYSLLAGGLISVHVLVTFVSQRLAQHVALASRLRAEKAAQEREAAWALELEERQRLEALGRLAGGVAHDFNNCLTALVGFSEIALRKLHSDPRAAERSLHELGQAAERAANLTSQLLDFASRRSTQPRPLDLRQEVKSSAELLSRVLRPDITLHVTLCPEPCVCSLDPSGLERVLVNLAVNARDAMASAGSLSIRLERDAERVPPSAVLTVADTGCGIEPEDLPHVFEPFFTTKARKHGTRNSGSGLGLASVYGVVKQSGGEIEVSSTPGQGTTFRIRFPLAGEQLAPQHRASPLHVERGSGAILLVDDDEQVRAVTRSHLEAGGFDILEAASAHDALTLDGVDRCRLVVSDVAMPGMSGLELSRRLRFHNPELPILLISGYSDADIAANEQLPERTRFLSKPFTRERLLTEVSRALSSGE